MPPVTAWLRAILISIGHFPRNSVADFTHVDVGPSGVHRVTTTWNQSAFGNALPVAPLCAMVRHIWDLVHGDNRHASEGGLSFRMNSWRAHDRSCRCKEPTSILQGNLEVTLNCRSSQGKAWCHLDLLGGRCALGKVGFVRIEVQSDSCRVDQFPWQFQKRS